MARYRHRIDEVRAVQWTGRNTDRVLKWCRKHGHTEVESMVVTEGGVTAAHIRVPAYGGGLHRLLPGDWLVSGGTGELCGMSHKDFIEAYERV